jgi:hypothetical protein
MVGDTRAAIFISHANPQDNAFTLWLGAKLAALGYEVWADVLRLKGGDDWQRKLEQALRQRTRKVLLVANAAAVDKQGVRNELQIANDFAKSIGDNEFIIPLRLGAFDAPFLIAQAQYIDFEKSWAAGLKELLELIETIPHAPSEDKNAVWRTVQQIHGKTIAHTPEILRSNWLCVESLPRYVYAYGFRSGLPEKLATDAMAEAPWPLVLFGDRAFLSCAAFDDLQPHFGTALPIIAHGRIGTGRFLDQGWKAKDIGVRDARNLFAFLVHQGLEKRFRARGLKAYEMANAQLAWWADIDTAPTTKIAFRWPGVLGLRQIQGRSDKRAMHWHYGVSAAFRSVPVRHVRLAGRLIFSPDGREPYDAPQRMHRLRRSFAKAWRNPRWRDMLLAFLFWLAEGAAQLSIPLGSKAILTLTLPPLHWTAPISIPVTVEDAEPDDDDPSDDEDIPEDEDGP